MQEKLLAIKEAAFNEISAAENSGTLEEIRVKYLGKKGELTTILRGMGSLSPEERPVVGKLVNEAKSEVEAKLEEAVKEINKKPCRMELNVNRNNKALGFYLHMGMKKASEGDFDIGNGFYMNDYIMSIDIE